MSKKSKTRDQLLNEFEELFNNALEVPDSIYKASQRSRDVFLSFVNRISQDFDWAYISTDFFKWNSFDDSTQDTWAILDESDGELFLYLSQSLMNSPLRSFVEEYYRNFNPEVRPMDKFQCEDEVLIFYHTTEVERNGVYQVILLSFTSRSCDKI